MNTPEEAIEKANVYIYDREHLDIAINILEEQANILKKENVVDTFFLPTILRKIGEAYWYQGEDKESWAYYQQAYESAMDNMSRMERGLCLACLSSYELSKGRMKEAYTYVKLTFPLIECAGEKFAEMKANALIAIANLDSLKRKYPNAFMYYKRSLDYSCKINDKMSFQKMMEDIPYIFSKLSVYGKGFSLYTSIINIINKKNMPSFLPQAYLSFSKFLMFYDQDDKSEDYILDSLNLCKEQCLIREEGEAYELLGDLYRKEGDLGYRSCYESAMSIYESCDYPNRIKRVTEKLNNFN